MIDIEYQEKLLNTREVAQLFRVPLKTVRNWVKSGLSTVGKWTGNFSSTMKM